jgi:hypothetical protein
LHLLQELYGLNHTIQGVLSNSHRWELTWVNNFKALSENSVRVVS